MEALADFVVKARNDDVDRHNEHATAIEQLLQGQIEDRAIYRTASATQHVRSTLQGALESPRRRGEGERSVRTTTTSRRRRLSTEGCERLKIGFHHQGRSKAPAFVAPWPQKPLIVQMPTNAPSRPGVPADVPRGRPDGGPRVIWTSPRPPSAAAVAASLLDTSTHPRVSHDEGAYRPRAINSFSFRPAFAVSRLAALA